jgi:hypothetical protein
LVAPASFAAGAEAQTKTLRELTRGRDPEGTARINADKNADAEVLPVFFTNCKRANLLVRSIAT